MTIVWALVAAAVIVFFNLIGASCGVRGADLDCRVIRPLLSAGSGIPTGPVSSPHSARLHDLAAPASIVWVPAAVLARVARVVVDDVKSDYFND